MSISDINMPYTLEITTISQTVNKTSTVFDSLTALHSYLTTAVEIWNGHWEGWSESDSPPAAPAMITLSMIGTVPTVVLNINYSDGFGVSATVSKHA